jgi:hypothetical protein
VRPFVEPDDLATVNLVIESDPIPYQPGRHSWTIIGRSTKIVADEIDKISRAVSEDGFASFHAPVLIRDSSSRYVGWFGSNGVTFDLL